jgi:phospholipase C
MGWTGTIDPNGTAGGPLTYNDNPATGFRWKTYAEQLQQAGIGWKVYQVSGNSGENVLPSFAAFMQATPGNPLYDRGRAGYSSLTTMINGFADVANNTLPTVS